METEGTADVRGEERGRWVFLEHIVGLKLLSIFNLKGFFLGSPAALNCCSQISQPPPAAAGIQMDFFFFCALTGYSVMQHTGSTMPPELKMQQTWSHL